MIRFRQELHESHSVVPTKRKQWLALFIVVFTSAASFGLLSNPHSAHADITSNLVGWWKLDDGSGTAAVDSSGNGSTGTLGGSPLPTWTTGQIGGALNFGGNADGDYVDMGNTASLSIATGTISAWINLATTSGRQIIISKDDWNNDRNGYQLYLNDTGNGPQIQVELSDATTSQTGSGPGFNGNCSYAPVTICEPTAAGVWYQVAVKWDGTNITYYLDGVNIGVVPETVTPISNVNNFELGKSPTYGASLFNGSIDDVRVYNRLLSDQDMTDLYNQGLSSPPSVSAQPATNLSTSTATLNGSIDNNNYSSSTVRGFEWGLTTSYGTVVSTSGTYGIGPFSTNLTGLSTNTTYHYRAFATNAAGTASSSDQTFDTFSATPPVFSSIGSTTSATSSTITWTTNIAGNSQVQYGVTTSYGSSTTIDPTLVTLHRVTLTGLLASTTYHFEVLSQNGSSTDQTFTTLPASNPITQSMFYDSPGLYYGYYYSNGNPAPSGYHYYIAEPFPGYYINASSTTVANPAWVVPDNTFYGDETGASTTYAADENAILLSTSTDSSIPLDFENLSPGVYFIRIIGRVNEATIPRIVKPLVVDLKINDGPNGQTDDYQMQVLYSNSLEETGRIFFNALNTTNNLHGVLSIATSSQEDLLVHRIDFFNGLAGDTVAKFKTSATTYTQDQESFIQTEAQSIASSSQYSNDCGVIGNSPLCGNNTIWNWMQNTSPVVPQGVTTQQRQERDDDIWNAFPPLNTMTTGGGDEESYSDWPNGSTTTQVASQYGTWYLLSSSSDYLSYHTIDEYDKPFQLVNPQLGFTYTPGSGQLPSPFPCNDSGFGCYFNASTTWGSPGMWQFIIPDLAFYKMEGQYSGAIWGEGSDGGADLAYRYYVTGDTNDARDISLALVRFALQYPGLQMEAQDVGYNTANPGLDFNASFRWDGQREPGKLYYGGWSSPLSDGYMQAYDWLYPYISGNQELADAVHRYVPWVNTPDDVITLIDTYLLQTIYNDSVAGRADLDNPLLLGLVLQNGPLANKLMDLATADTEIDPLGTASMLQQYHTSLGQDGTTLIGSMNYTEGESTPLLDSAQTIAEYKASSGQSVPYDTTNLTLFPKIARFADVFSNITVAGGYRPTFGDSGDGIDGVREAGNTTTDVVSNTPATLVNPELEKAWKYGGQNPATAWLLANVTGRTDEDDADWSAILAEASTTVDPRLYSQSRTYNGLGLGILETAATSSNYQDKSATVIRTGTGEGHAHNDALELNIFALGLRMGVDYGNRNDSAQTTSYPTSDSSYLDNTVEVDGYEHPTKAEDGWPAGSFTTDDSWIDTFAPGTSSQYISTEGKSLDHPNVNLFRRDDALIDITASSSFTFDVFRVSGGQFHTWSFHGADTDSEAGGLTLNTTMSTSLDASTTQYLRKFAQGSSRTVGTAPAVFQATWRLGRTANPFDLTNDDGSELIGTTTAAEQNMYGSDFSSSSPRKYTTVTMFGRAGDKVMTGTVYSSNYSFAEPNVFLQSGIGGTYTPTQNQRDDVYPAIIEAYAGAPLIATSSILTVTPNESDALQAVALIATTTTGDTDIMISDGRPTTTRNVGGLLTSAGQFGYYSSNNGNFKMMKLVGGTQLTDGNYSIQPTVGTASSTISWVDYTNQEIYTTTPIPTTMAGQDFHIYNANHQSSYTITAIANSGSGSVLTYADPADIAEIDVQSVSGDTLVSSSSWALDYVANRNQGFTGTNESGTKVFKIGKASTNEGETNNIISATTSISMSDFTDVNGDGDGIPQAIIYDFGYGDTIEADSDVSLTNVAIDPVFSINNDVDTTVTLPGSGTIQISNDQVNWTNLTTAQGNSTVSALVPGSTSTRYLQVVAVSNSGGGNSGGGGGTVVTGGGGGSVSFGGLASLLAPSTSTSTYLNLKAYPASSTITTSTPPTFTLNLVLGSTGPQVTTLQNLLATLGFLKVPATGYFGPLTEAAVKVYQSSKGISPVGYVGPATRAALNNQSISSAPSTVPAYEFTRNLAFGSTGADVKALQRFLNSHGYTVAAKGSGSPGNETTVFGYATEAALARFQKSNDITPAVGYFGPATRGVVNEMLK